MRHALATVTLLVFLCFSAHSFAQAKVITSLVADSVQTDTLTSATEHSKNADDDFSPAVFFFFMACVGAVLICVGTGIAATIFGILIIFGFVSFGVLSASVIVGLNKKSFAKGFKTFVILFSTGSSVIIGTIVMWLLGKIMHWWGIKTAIMLGISTGIAGGLAFGFLSIFVLKKLTTYFKERLNQ